MPPPALAPWMEQRYPSPCQGITSLRLLPLKEIAGATGQPQIFFSVGAAMGAGENMVNFEWPWHIGLGGATVPTPIRRGAADTRPEGRRKWSSHQGLNGARKPRRTASARASDCRIQSCW